MKSVALPVRRATRERRAIDLRTFRDRAQAISAPACSDRVLELVCVGELDTLVDGNELLRGEGGEPPYWALPWIGARAIAAELLAAPPSASSTVLDLGCGLGLAGVAGGRAGAHVVFADYVPEALEFVRVNAELHRLSSFEARVVDFTRDRLRTRFDLILAADIVYDPRDYEPLADFLDAYLAPEATLLLTESLRADARRVLDLLAGRGIVGEKRGLWLREEGRAERTWLHTLRRG